MKLARYLAQGKIHYGLAEADTLKALRASPLENPLEQYQITGQTHKLSEVQLLAPCLPTKILAIGLNYSSHLHGRPLPQEPLVFYKTSTSVIGPNETIIRPKDTARLDAEGELVIVMKDRCRFVPKEQALEHILGYTCGNDVSASDWQKEDRNWWRAKSADTFSPVGPFIATDIDPHKVKLTTRINGREAQSENTSYFIFDVPTLISFLTRFVTLEPGDLIFTGTPGEPGEIKDGDVCEVEIEGIGILRNPIMLQK